MNRKRMVKMWVAAMVAVATALPVAADVTINVKASSAPYLYVWTGDGDTAVKYNGDWPGTQMSETKVHNGVTYYTKTITGVDDVKAIFNAGSNTAQSGDYTGLSGDVYFEYDGNTKAWGVMPSNVIYESNKHYIYYVDIYGWGQVYAHVWGGASTTWPGQAMTKIGTDEAGYDVYRVDFSSSATNVIFNRDGDNSGADRCEGTYVDRGYMANLKLGQSGYSLEALQTLTADRLAITSGNFSDSNFRAALGEALGITLDSNNENATRAFTASDVEVLDVTGKSISSLSGIAHFTNLKELYAGENSIPGADLSALSALEVIDFHANSGLKGFTSNQSSSNQALYMSASVALKSIDLSDCGSTWFLALTSNSTATQSSLEVLKWANNPSGWSSGFATFTNLRYIDLSNAGLSSVSFTPSRLVNVEYLDLSDNSLTSLYASLNGGLASLKTLKVNNNTGLQYCSSLQGAPNLEHLEYRNIGLTRLTDVSATNCPKLRYLDISNNKASTIGTSVSFTGHAALDTLIIKNMGTSGSRITTLDASNNNLRHVEADGSYITTLNLSGNRLTEFTNAGNVLYLDLSGNLFTSIPEPVNTTLRSVEIGSNPFPTTITQQINSNYGLRLNNCPTVTSIDLSGSNITALMLGGMTGLQTLKINNCQYLHKTAVNNNATNLQSGLGCIYIAEATNLQTIEAANCRIGDTRLTLAQHPWGLAAENTDPSFTIPSGFNALKTLDLSGNGTLSIVHDIANAPNLESLDVHGCAAFSWLTQRSTLTGSNHQHLTSLDFSDCDISVSPVVVSGFPALTTLNIADNDKVTEAQLGGNALTSLDISGCTRLATLDVSDNEFSNINFLNVQDCAVTDLDISRNNISSLSGVSNASLVTLRINGSGLTSLAGVSNFPALKTLYAGSNAFSGALSLSGTQLEQIDLSSNTGITSLDAKNNSLNSMLLQGCTGLTTLDVSGNAFVSTGTGTTLSTGMLNISNLALTELNLSNNEFTTIGANSSLAGMANTLTKLEARNNKFTDFRNGKAFPYVASYTYTDEDGHTYTVSRASKAAQTSYNHISDLAALEWLDLSGNQKLDSVCVFFNPALKHLDLSDCHDPEQYGLETRNIRDKDTSNQLGLMLYKHTDNVHGGLYSLNLMANKNLEWLDISRTAIHETALTAISCEASYSSRGGYVYIHETPNLETFICNDNGMNSLGLAANTKLKHVEAQRMNGQSYIMRDNGANYGNINLHANVNGNSNSIEYFDVSNSGFSEVGVASACETAAIKTLIVDGNPLQGLNASNTAGINLRNGDALTDCRTPDLETLSAKNCGDLTEVNVNYCQKLTSVDLTGSQKVKSLKMMNCVGLTEVPSLDKPEILETLMCGYNTSLSDLDVTGYPALKTLNCQNNAIEELDLSLNPALVDLYASTNNIEELEIPSEAIMNVAVDHNGMFKLDIGTAPNLMNLDFSDNHICAIDLSGAGNMIVDVNAEGNSRTIKANSVTYVQDKGGEPVTLYFFQLDNSEDAAEYNTLSILDATCLEAGWAAHSMADDGFVIANATFSGTVAGRRQNRVASTADPSMLDADNIYGTIVPLGDSDDAVGYTYATGNTKVPTVSLGVNWESTSTPTAVVDLSADALSVRGEQGSICVQSPEATQLAVYDVSGRLVVLADVDAGESRIALEPGVYVVAGVKVAVR
ncbi:MAG: starch-binding protein [Muribaculaceae bacterium]|nr:starch-binding protein [Muribaculaceae bacterium]